ncbi:MAG: DUF4445 domain-containing protein [Clostridia bacterium]|nr:DUF4445 domain-containing protein [Clostridia bacterium]
MIATFQGVREKRTLFFSSPTLISELLERAGTGLAFPCLKQGKCGKCKVRVSGKTSPVTGQEKDLLTDAELEKGVRLACCTFANGNILINYTIPENYFQEFKQKLLKFSEEFDNNNVYNIIYDVGTTTIEVCAVAKNNGNKQYFSFTNPQIAFGSDVMSRLKYAKDHSLEELRRCVHEPFELIKKTLKPEKCVVTGNTVMLHFFEGKDSSGMLDYPFTPSDRFGYEKGGIYFPHCVSAFVGADVSCGILKSELIQNENALLIDIGTNCEMAYCKDGAIYCCSVAAGPAFEGFSTSRGETAKDGSIVRVYLDNGKICSDTLGGGKPSGITGSGIVDLVSVLLKTGVLKKDGYLKDNFFIPGTEVFITPDDVRQIQLAKASVRAGIGTICKDNSVSKVFIAGNFGNALNIQSCVDIGLFPESFLGKTEFIGNSSIDGGKLLLEDENRKKLGELIKKCKLVELAGNNEFAKKYIENIDF